MTHLDDGTLQALADGEALPGSLARDHVEACGPCQERLRALEADASAVASALSALDVTPPLERARVTVRARIARGEARVRGRGAWRRDLAKAAGLVLAFAAAAAAAIPGSPLRQWLWGDRTPEREAVAPSAVAEPVADPEDVAVTPQEVGIQMDPGPGELRVVLSGLPPGARVEVRLVEGIRSWIYAAEGARFETRPGAVAAYVPGSYVRVELSRSLAVASVEVEGVPYLRKTGDRLELPGPRTDSTDTEIRFSVP